MAQRPPLTRAVVTIRFRPGLAERLKRSTFEHRLAGNKPDTIQDAVNEAVELWLAKSRG